MSDRPTWQTVDLPLAGIDQRTAPPLSRGSLELVNYEFDRTGGLRQRRGTLVRGTMAAGFAGMTTYQGRPFAVDGNGSAYLWSSAGSWTPSLGRVCNAAVTRGPVVDAFTRARWADSSTASDGRYLVSYSAADWLAPPSYAVLDPTTLAVLKLDEAPVLASQYFGPIRWAPDGRGVYAHGSNLDANVSMTLASTVYNPTTMTLTSQAHALIVAGPGGAPAFYALRGVPYDCDAVAGRTWMAAAVAYATSAIGVECRLYIIQTTPVQAIIATHVIQLAFGNGAFNGDEGRVALSLARTGDTIRGCILFGRRGEGSPAPVAFSRGRVMGWTFDLSLDGTAIGNLANYPDVIDTSATFNGWVEHIAAGQLPTTGADAYFAVGKVSESGAAPLDNERRMWSGVNVNSGVAGAQANREQVGLAQKPIVRSVSDVWQPLVHSYTGSNTGSTSCLDTLWLAYPVVDQATDGLWVQALRGVAYGPDGAGSVGRVASGLLVPQIVRARDLEVGSALDADRGEFTRTNQLASLGTLLLDFGRSWQTRSAAFGSYLVLPGGTPALFDGRIVAEAGFAWRPEYRAVTGNALPGANYWGVQTYAWRDALGGLHLSEPSPTWTLANFGPAFTHTPYNLCLTRRIASVNPRGKILTTICWRSKNNAAEVLFRVNDGTAPAYPDTGGTGTSLLATIADSVADADLGERPVLYTSEGELPRVAPPSCRFVHAHLGRVWCADCEVPTELWYSHKRPDESDPEADKRSIAWSLANVLVLDSPCRALGTVRGALIAFCDGGVYVINGDGPGRDGLGTPYSVERLHENIGVGTVAAAATVSAPDGVYFLTDRGLYRIGLDLGLVPVGAPIQPLLDTNPSLRSPVVIPERHQIAWARPGSQDVLVYDYLVGQWARWQLADEGQGSPPVNCLAAGASSLWLAVTSTTEQLREQVEAIVTDNAVVPVAIVQTPWLRMNTVSGWLRTRKAGLTGSFGASKVTLDWRTNYSPSAGTSLTIDALPAGSRHAVVHSPAGASKAEAFSLRATITQPSGNVPHELWGITAEIQGMTGVVRRPSTERK